VFKLGCDPECFLLKDGHVISAIGKIGGTKYEPKPVLEKYGRGFALQEDNVLLEYNIPPADSFSQFTDNLDIIHHFIDRMLQEQGMSRATIASCSMHPKEMEDPFAWVFGCEPDFNAWTLSVNPRPHCDDPLFRSAGGHLHIGVPNLTKSQKIAIVRWLDRLVGPFLVKNDPDVQRSKLYGAPGACRFKSYGVEWRTPSNWWTFQPTSVLNKIYELIVQAVQHGRDGNIDTPKQNGFRPELLSNLEEFRKWEGAS
jgi:Phage phiEco32-like COOH.NH2 ligase-type 2